MQHYLPKIWPGRLHSTVMPAGAGSTRVHLSRGEQERPQNRVQSSGRCWGKSQAQIPDPNKKETVLAILQIISHPQETKARLSSEDRHMQV